MNVDTIDDVIAIVARADASTNLVTRRMFVEKARVAVEVLRARLMNVTQLLEKSDRDIELALCAG